MTRQTALLAGLGAVLVIALWWLFLFSPGQDELASVEDDIAAAESEQLSLQRRVVELEAVRARAPETEAAIARVQSVLPDSPELPAALRQIQAAADDAGVTLVGVATARPELVDEPIGLHAASLNLTAEASYFQLVDFLRRLENPEITARGITFTNLSVTSGDYPQLSVSLSGAMYAVLDPPPSPEDAVPADTEETADDAVDDAAEEAAEGEES